MVTLKDINLMPKYALSKKETKDLMKIGTMLLIIVIALSVFMDFGSWYAKVIYDNKVAEQKVEIERLLGADSDLGALNTVGQKIAYRNDVLKNVDKSRLKISKLFSDLQEIIPTTGGNTLHITNINVNNKGEVTLQGTSDKEETILDFYHSLKANKVGDYISFTTLNGGLGGGYFEFVFKFKLN